MRTIIGNEETVKAAMFLLELELLSLHVKCACLCLCKFFVISAACNWLQQVETHLPKGAQILPTLSVLSRAAPVVGL